MKENDGYGLSRIKRTIDTDKSLMNYRSDENSSVVKVVSDPVVEEILAEHNKRRAEARKFLMELREDARTGAFGAFRK
jgi:hypothetical protein